MGWVLRLVETGTDGSSRSVDVMAIDCLGDLGDIADLGLTLALLWCTEAEEHRFLPWFVDFQAARTDSGRPRSSIRLRTVTAIRVSTSWAGRVCERTVSPMMRLYRLIAPSAPALAL